MAVITAGGVGFPTPSEMSMGVMDLSKAERNTKGTMIIERIATKQKIELTWKYMTAADLKTVLNAVSGAFFSVTYTDPLTNAARTGTFYAGDRTAGVLRFDNGVPSYEDVKFNLIEK